MSEHQRKSGRVRATARSSSWSFTLACLRLRAMTKVLMLVAAAASIGCATTETYSSTYKSPQETGHQFRKVAVWVQAGLAARQDTENQVASALLEKRIDAYSSLAVWPIDASTEEMQAKLKAFGFDSVLVLRLEQSSSTLSSVGTFTTTSLWGNVAVSNTAVSTQSTDHAVYSATLFNEASGRVVWQSQAFVNGNEYAGWSDIRESFVEKTAGDVFAAHVMYLCAAPPPASAPSDVKQRYADNLAKVPPATNDCLPPAQAGKQP